MAISIFEWLRKSNTAPTTPGQYFIEPLQFSAKIFGEIYRFDVDQFFTFGMAFGISFIFTYAWIKYRGPYRKKHGNGYQKSKASGKVASQVKNVLRKIQSSLLLLSGNLLDSIGRLAERFFEPKTEQPKPCLTKKSVSTETETIQNNLQESLEIVKCHPNSTFVVEQKETTTCSAEPGTIYSLTSTFTCTTRSNDTINNDRLDNTKSLTTGTGLSIPVVVLYQLPRAQEIPCRCHARFHLESVFRLCEIPYKVICSVENASGPWMSYGAMTFEGIKHCLHFLEEKFSENLQGYQVPKDYNVPSRYLSTITSCHLSGIIKFWRNQTQLKTTVVNQRRGRSRYTMASRGTLESQSPLHSSFDLVTGEAMKKDEIVEQVDEDLLALSAALGMDENKSTFTGASITTLDCLVFSVLAQCLWGSTSGGGENSTSMLQELVLKYSNLVDFCEYIRAVLWHDWPTSSLQKLESDYYAIRTGFTKGPAVKLRI